MRMVLLRGNGLEISRFVYRAGVEYVRLADEVYAQGIPELGVEGELHSSDPFFIWWPRFIEKLIDAFSGRQRETGEWSARERTRRNHLSVAHVDNGPLVHLRRTEAARAHLEGIALDVVRLPARFGLLESPEIRTCRTAAAGDEHCGARQKRQSERKQSSRRHAADQGKIPRCWYASATFSMALMNAAVRMSTLRSF